jgi:lipopolysaccharide/colanic/teichoic acid biosynthesis glycosyltransferase
MFEPAKRAMDLVIACVAAVVVLPLMAAITIAIRLDSRGPALLRQSRVGRHGEDFELLKFRTMVVGAHTMGSGWLVAERDPRITRVGHFLRRWSLDELPQLFNVLRGEMSIVGPRPTLRYQVEQYTDFQRRRLEVPPGITGWAQVQGRNDLPWPERIELDVWYVDHRSLRLELEILRRTLRVLVTPSGIYNEARGDWGEKTDPAGHAEPVKDAPPETV